MKTLKKALAVVISLMLTLSLFVISAAAEDTVSVKMLSYNVAGLPSIGSILGMSGANVPENQRQLGEKLNDEEYDIIAVQEDFNYHARLARGLSSFDYKTIHSGGIPGGDGMNIFSKHPIYNEKRTPWNMLYGVMEGDELTPKGILYSVIDIGNGILVDFYVIHADAFDGEESRKARADNFKQLSEMITSKGNDRPVIVTGDFNTSTHLGEHGKPFTDYMIGSCGFKDAWTEIYNSGNYSDYSGFSDSYWGVWDSVEKFLYRDGGGVHIDAENFDYVDFKNADDESISDHKAASVEFSFTKTNEFSENTLTLKVARPHILAAAINKIRVIITDLIKIFTHFDEVIAAIKG